jgi:TRAP-type mannitol/chloroaromatic compound transport system permease small subunit
VDAVSRRLKRFSDISGNVISWLTLPMVIGTFVVVVLRYAFDIGWIWMQESVTWMHAAAFMLAAAYTLNCDEHVRVDIFYREMSAGRRAWVDLLGTLLFLLPMSAFLIATSWDYVSVSWQIREGSREAGGLPYPMVPLLKTVIPITAALLVLQGVANAIDACLVLCGRRPSPDTEAHPLDREGL